MTIGPAGSPNLAAPQSMESGTVSVVRAYCADAETFLHQDRFAEARATVKQALRLAPNDPAAHNILGVIDLQRGHLASAAASIGRAVELKPDAPEPHHYLGLVHQHMGRYEEAITSYRAALALRPGTLATTIELAKLLKFLGRFD